MSDQRVTNWLLTGILLVLSVHLWTQMERSAQADTLRLDYCITERIQEAPEQFLHVVTHSPER